MQDTAAVSESAGVVWASCSPCTLRMPCSRMARASSRCSHTRSRSSRRARAAAAAASGRLAHRPFSCHLFSVRRRAAFSFLFHCHFRLPLLRRRQPPPAAAAAVQVLVGTHTVHNLHTAHSHHTGHNHRRHSHTGSCRRPPHTPFGGTPAPCSSRTPRPPRPHRRPNGSPSSADGRRTAAAARSTHRRRRMRGGWVLAMGGGVSRLPPHRPVG
mmetsp:Transcript_37180/g.93315  ORF Transcript_37180/g.93315 Transcript_37180/m.93315 type:complete len:213 (-) Transcript_37180:493-1131(-)